MLRTSCIITIILLSLLNYGESKCVAREYKNPGGKKGEPNTKRGDYKDNISKCKDIKDPDKCGNPDPQKGLGKICLWVNGDEDGSVLEGKYIKSVTYLGKKIANKKSNEELEKEWKAGMWSKSKYDGKKKIATVPKLITIDSHNIMYEIELTDQDDFNKYYGTEWQKETQQVEGDETSPKLKVKMTKGSLSKPKNKELSQEGSSPGTITGSKPIVIKSKPGQLVQGYRRRLINGQPLMTRMRRRRLIEDVPQNERGNSPYNGFGLIVIQTIGNPKSDVHIHLKDNKIKTKKNVIDVTKKTYSVARGAGGTVIWEGPAKGEYKSIYVLAAGHDVIDDQGAQLSGLENYQFWQGWNGDDEERIEKFKERADADTRRTRVDGLQRAWVHRGYADNDGAPEFDIGLMKFSVHRTFVAHRVGISAMANFPNAKNPQPPAYRMVAYNMPYVIRPKPPQNRPGPVQDKFTHQFLKTRIMQRQDVRPYGPVSQNALQYEDVPIKKGFCGGIILNTRGRIIAMQVSMTNRIDGEQLNGCDDHDTNTDFSNCRGHGTRITYAHVSAFKWMVGRPPVIQQHNPNNWQQVDHQPRIFHQDASVEYDDMYDDMHESNEYVRVHSNHYGDHDIMFDGYSHKQKEDNSMTIYSLIAICGLLTICLAITYSCICGAAMGSMAYYFSSKSKDNKVQAYRQMDVTISE